MVLFGAGTRGASADVGPPRRLALRLNVIGGVLAFDLPVFQRLYLGVTGGVGVRFVDDNPCFAMPLGVHVAYDVLPDERFILAPSLGVGALKISECGRVGPQSFNGLHPSISVGASALFVVRRRFTVGADVTAVHAWASYEEADIGRVSTLPLQWYVGPTFGLAF